MPMHLFTNDNAAKEHSCVLVELPPGEVVAATSIVRPSPATLSQANPAAAQVMMEWMGQPECLMFFQFPARMKPADVVGDVTREESVLPPLDLLLQSLTVVRKGRSFPLHNTRTERCNED